MARFARAISIVALALAVSRTAAAEPRLQRLAATVGEGQGVYAVAGDGEVLVAQAENHAVHPASVTKIATSLALLERLGPAYRFTTMVGGTGALRDGHLEGDLVVDGGGDPFLVDEGAFLLLQRLHARGLRIVDGHLVTRGPLLLDWQPDPAGRRLEGVLRGAANDAGTVGAWRAVAGAAGPASPRDAALVFLHRETSAGAATSLVVYRSPPLLEIVKALNGYSNNVFHFAADAIGGAAAVEAGARAHVSAAMRDEIVIANGAGAGTANRMSPRAVVALLDALAQQLAAGGTDLTAALPVSGIDPGTLHDRLPDARGVVVGKTGTFGSVGASALVGALTTPTHGVVRFAVLNHGVPVPEARTRQDAFTRALIAAVAAQPWAYGAPARAAYLDAQVE